MSKRKRQKFSDEFKEDAMKLITEQGYSIVEAARNLGINANQLGRWKREIENPSERNGGFDQMASMQAELKRLRKENKQLKVEREILKKAAAFFVKEQGEGIGLSILRRRYFLFPCYVKLCV